MELITGENDKGRRLDRILRKALPDRPLPLLHRLLRQGHVLVNGKPAKAQDRLDSGAIISIPSLTAFGHESAGQKPVALPSPAIIWQGHGLIAVNKPPGLEVHGSGTSLGYSLDKMVQAYLAGKIAASLSFKPGPLHRLDKPTSGIVIFSTSIEGARNFSSLMREQKVQKTYLAILEGTVKNDEIWEDELVRDKGIKKTFISEPDTGGLMKHTGSKTAITKITLLAAKDNYSLIKAEIATGRTHQIRAQAAAHGHPLAGDRKYGGHGHGGLFLHSWKINFSGHSIEAPPPETFMEKITTFLGIRLSQNLINA